MKGGGLPSGLLVEPLMASGGVPEERVAVFAERHGKVAVNARPVEEQLGASYEANLPSWS